MFGIVLSALNAALGYVLRSVVVKFVVMFAFYYVTTELIAALVSYLPDGASVTSAFGGIGSDVWYFLDVFQFSTGFPIVLAGFATRFLIRRLPVIG